MDYTELLEELEDDFGVEVDNFMEKQKRWKKVEICPNISIYKLTKSLSLFYIRIEKSADVFVVQFRKTDMFHRNYWNKHLVDGEFREFKKQFYIYKLKYNL